MPSRVENAASFPGDLPLAPIAIVSYQKLLDGNRSEAARVLEAAKTHGFFYLDLQTTPDGEALLSESAQLNALARDAFAMPLAEKLQYALERGVSLFGYKPAGTVKTTDRDQRRDTTEFFSVAKDHLHGVIAAPTRSGGQRSFYPPALEQQRPLLRSFTGRAHACGMLVLRVLAEQLGLAPDAFERLNRFDRPSGDHCRLTRKEGAKLSDADADGDATGSTATGSIGLPSHTDFGSVTILFNWLGGLQIQMESSSSCKREGGTATATAGTTPTTETEWAWVKPLPGHAIINLGDAMVIFTHGLLKSAKHRVVPAPGVQAAADRYSVVYFVRPHNDAPMTPLAEFDNGGASFVDDVAGKFSAVLGEGEILTAGEWMRQRAIQLGN